MGWIAQLVSVLLAASLAGRLLGRPLAIPRWAGPALGRLVYPLVATQGVVIGLDPGVVARLPVVGAWALALAAGSLIASALAARLALGSTGPGAAQGAETAGPPPWRAGLQISLALAAGIALGVLGAWPAAWDAGAMSGWLLLALVALVGLELGASDAGLGQALRQGPRLLWIPAAAVTGTLLVGGLATLLLGGPGLTAVAGLGWYSLAGPLVTQGLGPEAGALAFLSCLARELLVVISAPALVARLGGPAAAAAAGATAMDTALPFLVRAGGPGLAVAALVSGGLCSLLAPWLLAAAVGLAAPG